MAFTFPTSGLTNGQVFVTPAGIAYTYNSTTNAWAPGFTRSQFINQSFVATAAQTVFTVLGGYTPGLMDIYVRGTKLPTSDFTATNGTTFTLVNQCEAGDDIQVRSFAQFTLANMVQKNSVAGDTMDNVIIGANKPVAATVTTFSATSLNGGSLTGFKNRIINGDARIDQRNNFAFTTPTSSAYFCDRWSAAITVASKLSFSANQGIVSAQVGPANSGSNIYSALCATVSTSYTPVAGDTMGLYQQIEGYNVADLRIGTANAQPFTISFFAFTNLAGTYAFRLIIGSSTAYSYVNTYTIAANTWTYFTFTIPALTSGPVGQSVSNGAGLQLFFDLGTGSTYQTTTTGAWISGNYAATASSTKLVANASGSVLYITGVQLEKGSVATAFENRPRALELSLCQRYFWYGYVFGTAMRTGSGDANGTLRGTYSLPVSMLFSPTITVSANSGAADGDPTNSGTYSSYQYPASATVGRIYPTGFTLQGGLPSGVGSTVGYMCQTTFAISAQAEL